MKNSLSSDQIKSAMIVVLVRIEFGRTEMSFSPDSPCVAGVIVSLTMNGFPDSGHPSNSLSSSCNVGKDGISSSSASFSCVASFDVDHGCEGS